MVLLKEILIQPLPHHVAVTQKVREKWKDKFDPILGRNVPVQTNPDSAGLPKYVKPSGNDVFANGKGSNFSIGKYLTVMRDLIMEQLIKETPITEFPLTIELEFYTTRDQIDVTYRNGKFSKVKKKRDKAGWDIGNYWIWSKVVDDCLKPYSEPISRTKKPPSKDSIRWRGWKGLIPDDDVDYIRSTGKITWFPINNYDDRKLVVKIFKYEEN